MALAVGTNSWISVADANTYFGDRVGVTNYWCSGAEKEEALVTAWRWLTGCSDYTFPATAVQAMKDAQCEYALFLLQHQPDIDLRMGLQAQGVVEAGVVKEKYGVGPGGIPLPPIVQGLLRAYYTGATIKLLNLERDDEESVTYDAYTNRGT